MIQQPLKVFGGKRYLAPWIISHFPSHIHYVEPYCGGCAVLLQKPDEWVAGHSEVINDIHGELVNFWRVLRDPDTFSSLQKLLAFTPISQEEWDAVLTEYESSDVANFKNVYRAWMFFVLARQSREGKCKCFATLSRNRTRRGMNEQAAQWLSAIEGLPEVHERLKRVVILNDEALNVIRREDGRNTFFYLDPPYLHETRVTTEDYQHEMTAEQHEGLLKKLAGIEGKFALSGYRSELYDKWAEDCGVRREDCKVDCKASAAKVKSTRIESLWMNYC